jgi:hypothetical protein
MYNGCQYDSGTDGLVLTLNCIFPLIANIIYWAIGLAGTISLFMIIFAGYQLIFSGGDAKAVEGARKTLTFAILGLFLVFLSFLILNTIATFTGVGCLNFSNGIPTSFSACAGQGGGGSF